MEPLEYLHLQMRLEGIEVFSNCFLRQAEIVPGEDLPLMLVAQLADGKRIAYYDETILPKLQRELSATVRAMEFRKIDLTLDVLRKYNLQYEVGHYKTYVFPSTLTQGADVRSLLKHDPKVKEFGFDGFQENVYTIESEDQIVSACVSVRENDRCGEAWVYTRPTYRHQGLAQKVVNAWAGSLMSAGKIPFYSHRIDNIASSNLARKLRLLSMFEEILITQLAHT
jgi:hypothetical protein